MNLIESTHRSWRNVHRILMDNNSPGGCTCGASTGVPCRRWGSQWRQRTIPVSATVDDDFGDWLLEVSYVCPQPA